jgi:hypothetical protein
VAVSASLSQAKDAREANLGSGLLALQAAALHLLVVAMTNGSLFSLQLPPVIVVILSSFVMVPALCSEVCLQASTVLLISINNKSRSHDLFSV